jgi:cytoskeleton protein RodZ
MSTTSSTTAGARTTTTPARQRHRRHRRRVTPARRVASLQLRPTGAVWVCLLDARGRKLVPGQVIDRSTSLPTFRSREFVMTLGNGNLTLRVNGKTVRVPAVQNAIGYRIDRSGKRTVLASGQRPTCA